MENSFKSRLKRYGMRTAQQASRQGPYSGLYHIQCFGRRQELDPDNHNQAEDSRDQPGNQYAHTLRSSLQEPYGCDTAGQCIGHYQDNIIEGGIAVAGCDACKEKSQRNHKHKPSPVSDQHCAQNGTKRDRNNIKARKQCRNGRKSIAKNQDDEDNRQSAYILQQVFQQQMQHHQQCDHRQNRCNQSSTVHGIIIMIIVQETQTSEHFNLIKGNPVAFPDNILSLGHNDRFHSISGLLPVSLIIFLVDRHIRFDTGTQDNGNNILDIGNINRRITHILHDAHDFLGYLSFPDARTQ